MRSYLWDYTITSIYDMVRTFISHGDRTVVLPILSRLLYPLTRAVTHNLNQWCATEDLLLDEILKGFECKQPMLLAVSGFRFPEYGYWGKVGIHKLKIRIKSVRILKHIETGHMLWYPYSTSAFLVRILKHTYIWFNIRIFLLQNPDFLTSKSGFLVRILKHTYIWFNIRIFLLQNLDF